jgi:hypothetical protein
VEEIDGKTRVVLTGLSGPGGIVGKSLADGNYRLLIDATKVRERQLNQALDGDGDGAAGGDRVDEFFRLFGDSDGNRTVDDLDLNRFRSAMRSRLGMANYRWYFDYDSDNDVDSVDYIQFLSRRGKTLNP